MDLRKLVDVLEQKFEKKEFKSVDQFRSLARFNVGHVVGTVSNDRAVTTQSCGSKSFPDRQALKTHSNKTSVAFGKRKRPGNNQRGSTAHGRYEPDDPRFGNVGNGLVSITANKERPAHDSAVLQDGDIATVLTITGCTAERASQYLSLSDGDASQAVPLSFDENGGGLLSNESNAQEMDALVSKMLQTKNMDDFMTWLNGVRSYNASHFEAAKGCISIIMKTPIKSFRVPDHSQTTRKSWEGF